MKPLLPEELSALMDGELDAVRAREVESQIVADPQLRAEYERLVAADARWRAAASTAGFTPAVRLPAAAAGPASAALQTALVVVLIAVRMTPKLLESLPLGLGLHAVALAVLLAALWRIALADDAELEVHA
jgi:anti-sigma factor RsiW